jgi:predicted metal-dependent peptidase
MTEETKDTQKTFNLNDHVHRLLVNEPFFASLSRRIDKKVNTGIPTAGVRIDPKTAQFELSYNPNFFAPLSDAERTGVIVHEFYHLVFEHVTGRLPDELAGVMTLDPRDVTKEQAGLFKLWNIAADLSINCLIGRSSLPENCCYPGEGPFEALPAEQTAEWYFEKLKEMQEEGSGDGSGGEGEGEGSGGSGGFDPDNCGQFDDHGDWGSGDGEASEAAQAIAKERLKEAIEKAAEDASKSRNWGSVSQSCRKEILDRITSKVDWRKVLRYFVKTSQRANKRSTVRRLNKRYPYIHPGRKVTRQARIAVSIDQSGSVDDGMLAAFFSELNKLAEIASFTVIPFDTVVNEDLIYEWKKGENRKRERVMYGGTDFNPPTEYVNKHGFDGHIVLTDLCAPKPKASKCQRMWMTTKEYASRPYFTTSERIIAIDSD